MLGIVLTIALAGCTSAPNSKSLQLPRKDIDQWVMPLDQYVLSTKDIVSSDYAENLLVSPCMSKKGYDFPVTWRNLNALHGPSFNDAGARLFNVKLASAYGYQVGPNTDPSAVAAASIRTTSPAMSDEEYRAFSSCLNGARKTVHLLPHSAQGANTYSNDAISNAADDSAVKSTVAKWKQCMRPLGIADLPDSPQQMPSKSLTIKFGMNKDGGEAFASAEEIQIATKDANCQRRTGYLQALYNSEWTFQVQRLESNADDLNRIYAMLTKHRKEVQTVVSAHAPAH